MDALSWIPLAWVSSGIVGTFILALVVGTDYVDDKHGPINFNPIASVMLGPLTLLVGILSFFYIKPASSFNKKLSPSSLGPLGSSLSVEEEKIKHDTLILPDHLEEGVETLSKLTNKSHREVLKFLIEQELESYKPRTIDSPWRN